MIYSALRWIAGVALHWFYGEIRITGKERIPRDAPLLIAVNHPNALVDSLLIGWLMPRHVVMTAKATLLENPFIAVLFRVLGVVPLRRAHDEVRKENGTALSPARNTGAFHEILHALSHNGAVLFFPEGISHGNSELAPLKSGLARVALQARDTAHIEFVQIIPIGLQFENKATPGSAVFVQVGNPIDVDTWPEASDHTALTAELTRRLRSVTRRQPITTDSGDDSVQPGAIKRTAISLAAMWGRLTHRLPIRLARQLALRISTDTDQPAMFTMIIGVGLVIATYALHVAVVSVLVHSFWVDSLYLGTLLLGAYWAAFEPHVKR